MLLNLGSKIMRIINIIILINLAFSLVALLLFAFMFGVLTESFSDALMFPAALISMFREGDIWAIWIIFSVVATLIWYIAKRGHAPRNINVDTDS